MHLFDALQSSLSTEPVRGLILIAYFVVLGLLSLYGLHRYQILYLFYRHRRVHRAPVVEGVALPLVTVQLPVYNEVNVAGRLIDAVCAMEYPRDRLEVQVLDDSDDETSEIVAQGVLKHRARGVRIHHVRREGRRGFKAGALEEGQKTAAGDLIAIFDADFVPPADFLMRLVPHFSDSSVGMVQARWDHLNRDYSLLTRVQSLLLDGHFVLEHAARNTSGRFFNFNGTAGIWRRRCIEEAGGWQHDTLTEDLDLSYRAQVAGWKFVFLPGACAPAELPVEMDGFKSQQHRWAKGSVQTAGKLLGGILRSGLSASVKAEAFVHLTSNFCYVLMVALAILVFPAMIIRTGGWGGWLLMVDLPLFLISTASVSSFYLCSQREIGRSIWRTLPLIPPLMAIGIGLSVGNSRAVIEGLWERGGEFARTPKFRVEGRKPAVPRKRYRGDRSLVVLLEAALAAYLGGAIFIAAAAGRWAAIPFLALFCWGFAFTASLSILQRLRPALAPSDFDAIPSEA